MQNPKLKRKREGFGGALRLDNRGFRNYLMQMSIVLKDVPEDLRVRLEHSASANRRTVDQEALSRLERSFEIDVSETPRHQRWIDEALAGGPAESKSQADWDALKKRVLKERK